MEREQKIYVAGHRGMVGAAIVRVLQRLGHVNIVHRTHKQLDLTDQRTTREFFGEEQPDQVYLAAARVGGILANSNFPASFIYENLMIEANVIHEAWRAGVGKLLFLGSSCIYPKFSPQPMQESALLGGGLEPSNEPYAVAKIAGIKLCESYNRQYGTDYRSVMPTNLYGAGDTYDPENSHVIPALIMKFHQAVATGSPEVTLWGTGTPRREFLHVDDMAAACVHVMNLDRNLYESRTSPMLSHVNVGSGQDIPIRELAEAIAGVVGFSGTIRMDPSKPDGTPRKLMDGSLLHSLGWRPVIGLEEGLKKTYRDFLSRIELQESRISNIN